MTITGNINNEVHLMQTKEEQIIEKALQVFTRYSYKKTTMEDIAKLMDMTSSNLYFYFKSKKVLYETAVEGLLDKWRSYVLDRVNETEGATAKLKVMMREAYQYIKNDQTLASIVRSDPSVFSITAEDDKYYKINSKAREILINILKEGIETKEFRPLNLHPVSEYLFSTYMMFLIMAYTKDHEEHVDQMWIEFIDITLRGLINYD